MSTWAVSMPLIARGGAPLFQCLAQTIIEVIRSGQLLPGDALPGSRKLAEQFSVHRNTAVAAYRELHAQGWLVTEQARGTFVAPELPATAIPAALFRAEKSTRTIPWDLRSDARLPPMPGPKVVNLGGGVPDVRLVPADVLARAIRRAMRKDPLGVLSYGEPAGPLPLRRAIAKMVTTTRGVVCSAENVLVVRGSQMGIDLIARTFLRPGDVVAVEAFGYRPAWEALAASQAKLVAIPVDDGGIDVDALEARLAKEPLRGLYLTPHHQFPTTTTLDAARRLRVLELARKHGFWVLEDDYDHEFHYEGPPVLPLAANDPVGSVMYIGTFSKVLAPGLRLGFVVAPAPVVERLAHTRRFVDRQGDHILAAAVTELIEDGEVQRHVRRARRIYAQRRAQFTQLLDAHFGGILEWKLPNGGTAVWARVLGEIDVDAWAAHALGEHELIIHAAKHFAFDGRSRPFLRLGFAQHTEREAKEAIRRLKASMPRGPRSRRRS